MEAKELRIGNLALEKDNGIITIDGAMIKWLEEGSYRGIQPIQLTEEWLKNFGFESTETIGVYGKNKIYCDIHSLAIELSFPEPNKVILTTDLKYVHQLQNLYFALTEEELTVINSQPIKK